MARTYKRDQKGQFATTGAGARVKTGHGVKRPVRTIEGPKAVGSKVAVPVGRTTQPPRGQVSGKRRQDNPRFLSKLQPPDTKAVAAKGAYVYGYVRKGEGTPYYVGISKNAARPFGPHSTAVPKDRSRVIIMRSGLTHEQAKLHERRYIARYGRQDIGTGILRNFSDGGEGAAGAIRSRETRAKISAAHRGMTHGQEARVKMSAARKGKSLTAEHRAKLSAAGRGRVFDNATRAKIGAAHRGKSVGQETRDKMRANQTGKRASDETRAKMSASHQGINTETRAKMAVSRASKGAAELGIPLDAYMAMSATQRFEARKMKREGPPVRGGARATRGAAELGVSVDAYMSMSVNQRSLARKKKRDALP